MTRSRWALRQCEAAAARARAELRADLDATIPVGAAHAFLARIIADHAGTGLSSEARRMGIPQPTQHSRWARAGCPPFVRVRDTVRAHLLAACLQDEAIPVAVAALEIGECSSQHLARALLRATGQTPAQWRRSVTPTKTRHAWRRLLTEAGPAFRALALRVRITTPRDLQALRRAELLALRELERVREALESVA